MSNVSDKLERQARNNPAAVKLARRWGRRDRYRRLRDRKLRDWIGYEFEWRQEGRDELNQQWPLAVIQISSYNPANHIVGFWMKKGSHAGGHIIWGTDFFWRECRAGRLKRG